MGAVIQIIRFMVPCRYIVFAIKYTVVAFSEFLSDGFVIKIGQGGVRNVFEAFVKIILNDESAQLVIRADIDRQRYHIQSIRHIDDRTDMNLLVLLHSSCAGVIQRLKFDLIFLRQTVKALRQIVQRMNIVCGDRQMRRIEKYCFLNVNIFFGGLVLKPRFAESVFDLQLCRGQIQCCTVELVLSRLFSRQFYCHLCTHYFSPHNLIFLIDRPDSLADSGDNRDSD